MSGNTKIKRMLRTKEVDTQMLKMAEIYAYRNGRRGFNVALPLELKAAKERRQKLKVVVKEPA